MQITSTFTFFDGIPYFPHIHVRMFVRTFEVYGEENPVYVIYQGCYP
jgi:hypothetical protein